MLHEGQLGVHPPGALGVAFFVHAGAECFIGRGGDGITQPLKDFGTLNLDDDGTLRSIPLRARIFANLLETDALDRMPELLLVCCNPDQLGLFTGELVRFLENLSERGRLQAPEDVRREVPILLILPNGILAERPARAGCARRFAPGRRPPGQRQQHDLHSGTEGVGGLRGRR
jgi:hypothetical protein